MGVELENISIQQEEEQKLNGKRIIWAILKLKYDGGLQIQSPESNQSSLNLKDQKYSNTQLKESFQYLSPEEIKQQQLKKLQQKEKLFNQNEYCLKQCQTEITLLPKVEYKFLKEGQINQQSQILKTQSQDAKIGIQTQMEKHKQNLCDKNCQTQQIEIPTAFKQVQTKQILTFDKSIQTLANLDDASSFYETQQRRLIKMKSFSNMQQLVESKNKKNCRQELSPPQNIKIINNDDEQDFDKFYTQKTVQDDEFEYQSLRLSNFKLPTIQSNNSNLLENQSCCLQQSEKLLIEKGIITEIDIDNLEKNDIISEGILNYLIKLIEEKNNKNNKSKIFCIPTNIHMKLFLKQASYGNIRDLIIENNLLNKYRLIIIPAYYHWYREFAICIIDIKKKLVKQFFLYKRLNIKNDPVFQNLRLIFEREYFNYFKEDIKWTLQIADTKKVSDVNMTPYVLLNIINQYLKGSTKISAISLKLLKENILKIIRSVEQEEQENIELFQN